MRERGIYGGPRCESRLRQGTRSWRCICDAGHTSRHLSISGGRTWVNRATPPTTGARGEGHHHDPAIDAVEDAG